MSSPELPARRLFIGLMPDPGVQAAIQDHGRAWYWPPGCRLTRPGRLHLTLQFLGDVDAAHEQALCAALRDTTMAPLELTLRQPEVWGNGVAVLRPDEHEGLRALHQRLGDATARADLPPMHRWTPHVTLARHAVNARPPETTAPIRWRAAEFVLIWSRLAPVARYEVLARHGLHAGVEG